MTEPTAPDGVDRRRLIKAMGGAGAAVALAGCPDPESDDGNETNATDTQPGAATTRPSLPADPRELDQPQQFIVQSLDYQNRLLEQLVEDES